jgi:hypothetical protein
MSRPIDLEAPIFCICVAAVMITFILAVAFSESSGMTYYEKQAYEEYLDVCRMQNITPQPPFNLEDFDTKQ